MVVLVLVLERTETINGGVSISAGPRSRIPGIYSHQQLLLDQLEGWWWWKRVYLCFMFRHIIDAKGWAECAILFRPSVDIPRGPLNSAVGLMNLIRATKRESI